MTSCTKSFHPTIFTLRLHRPVTVIKPLVLLSHVETLLIESRRHDDYKFLENSVDFADGIDDHELWQETEDAANILGFTDDQRIAMYKTCAGILHWGNGKFKQRPREEQAEVADAACKFNKEILPLGISSQRIKLDN